MRETGIEESAALFIAAGAIQYHPRLNRRWLPLTSLYTENAVQHKRIHTSNVVLRDIQLDLCVIAQADQICLTISEARPLCSKHAMWNGGGVKGRQSRRMWEDYHVA